MTTALIAAAAALFGVVVGRLWDSRSEAARWRRDQQAASYQRFAEEFRATCEAMRTLALADPESATSPELVSDFRRNYDKWDNAYTAVWLHGSPAVVTAAIALDRAQTELFYDVQQRHLQIEDWYHLRVTTREAFERFIRAVRNELDLKPVSANYFPDLASQIPSRPPE